MNTLDQIRHKFGLTRLDDDGGIEIHGINRTIMAQTLGELGFKTGAEIGVAQGWHAEILCKNIPDLKLYAVDIWDKYEGYNEYTDRIDRYYKEAQARLAPYNCEFVKKFSMDAVRDFADNSLDFVYIDGAHDFKNAVMDVCEWTKKVRVGGVVFGHDYKRRRIGDSKYPVGVKDAIQAYCYYHAINPWFVLTNDVKDPLFGRDNPGWMFVRQETDRI